MSTNPTTPGAYIREISTIPPSVAPVSTAVPGFAGYTEKGPLNTPTRISSMLEFEQIFGGAFTEKFNVNSTTLAVTPQTSFSEYNFYYHLQLYFANGGGPCWIVAADYYQTSGLLTASKMKDAIEDFRPIDEVTLLAAPELGTSAAAPATTYSEMLLQAAELQDRFAILDAKSTGVIATDASNFRSISLTNLKYGAAYYPTLTAGYVRKYDEFSVAATALPPAIPAAYGRLDVVRRGIGAVVSVLVPAVTNLSTSLTITVDSVVEVFTAGVDFVIASQTNLQIRNNLFNAIQSRASLKSRIIIQNDYSAVPNVQLFVITAIGNGMVMTVTGTNDLSAAVTVLTGVTTPAIVAYSPDPVMYRSVEAAIAKTTIELSPSAAMAGIYCTTDRDRGVWKAPANISLSNVIQPTVLLNDADQGGLNVDPASGKSINVIRQFSGKGNVVWGARTLAGNDNEWRYVNVRRLFNFAEESIKKATEVVVFDPNDRNTWNRVRALISNFLTNLWRDGGLVGATPEQAFFVRVGLGETMTEDDILNGRLVVAVGLAASRPAEFIELRFSHMLQQS
jgi:uncharacterized protein